MLNAKIFIKLQQFFYLNCHPLIGQTTESWSEISEFSEIRPFRRWSKFFVFQIPEPYTSDLNNFHFYLLFWSRSLDNLTTMITVKEGWTNLIRYDDIVPARFSFLAFWQLRWHITLVFIKLVALVSSALVIKLKCSCPFALNPFSFVRNRKR